MIQQAWPAQFDRAAIRQWIEEASGAGLSVDDPLPDSLMATAQGIGLQPAELRLWIFDQPRIEWRALELERWARRYGLARSVCGHCGAAVTDPEEHQCQKTA